jgi:hypothetical protein
MYPANGYWHYHYLIDLPSAFKIKQLGKTVVGEYHNQYRSACCTLTENQLEIRRRAKGIAMAYSIFQLKSTYGGF